MADDLGWTDVACYGKAYHETPNLDRLAQDGLTPGELDRTVEIARQLGVGLGDTLRFTNAESAAIWHTITSCKFPCIGPTGAAYPLANGRTSQKRKLDFDSSEVGFGTPAIGPATNKLNWSLDVTKEEGYKPGEVVTYFCRIHPFMRGAFEVAK